MEQAIGNDKNIRIECQFNSPRYGAVGCLIKIRDGGIVAKFSDRRLAKDWVDAEVQGGNINIRYIERLSAFVEAYPGMKDTEIAKLITKELEEHNAVVKEKK